MSEGGGGARAATLLPAKDDATQRWENQATATKWNLGTGAPRQEAPSPGSHCDTKHFLMVKSC